MQRRRRHLAPKAYFLFVRFFDVAHWTKCVAFLQRILGFLVHIPALHMLICALYGIALIHLPSEMP